MDLSKERSLVLEMISDGQITVDEGEELLQALNASIKKKTFRTTNEYQEVQAVPAVPSMPAVPAIPHPCYPGNSCHTCNTGYAGKNILWRIPKR